MAQVKKETACGLRQLEDDPTEQSDHPQSQADSAAALQSFLDRIPISSLPGINNFHAQVLELRAEHSVRDAVRLLYEGNVSGAPIADAPSGTSARFSDRYIGFIDLASLVLWSLEELEKESTSGATKEHIDQSNDHHGFFSMLDQIPRIGQTKLSELAKSFLWGPFLPVRLEDSLFHVLLLFSKHRLQVLPVTEASKSKVIGFVTQNAVIQLLLQSSGLEWFDNVADQALSELIFENENHVVYVYEDQTIAEALHTLWRNERDVMAVLDRKTGRLTGCIRSSDVHFLLDNDYIFHNRENTTAKDFIHMDPPNDGSRGDPTINENLGSLLKAGVLRLKDGFHPRMDSPITNKKRDTLKQAMKKLADGKSDSSFLVDVGNGAPQGVLTSRDIITQFAPPSIDSSSRAAHGFFELALEQTGCHVERADNSSKTSDY